LNKPVLRARQSRVPHQFYLLFRMLSKARVNPLCGQTKNRRRDMCSMAQIYRKIHDAGHVEGESAGVLALSSFDGKMRPKWYHGLPARVRVSI
jgi:hypothetical protein